MKIYVGNMNFRTTEEALRDLFSQHGQVDEVLIVSDRETGRPRGFAFVTMPDDAQAQAAIAAVHGQEIDGRTLAVNEARPKTEGGPRRDGGGLGGGDRGRGGNSGGGMSRERSERW